MIGLVSDVAVRAQDALRRARGEGGTPDPQLEALLAHNAQKLKEKQEMAKLVSKGDVVPMRNTR